MLIMGSSNDDRSVNGAALRNKIPMFATELGGGGWASPDWVTLAEDGIYRVLHALGMWALPPPKESQPSLAVRLAEAKSTVYASRDGIFVACVKLGDDVGVGQPLGTIYSVAEIERTPLTLTAQVAGRLMCATRYGLVKRGDFLLQIGQHVLQTT
jgi:predicted deacylase